MSAKLEKQVSLPSGNSTIQQQQQATQQQQQQQILLETTVKLLDSNNSNEKNIMLTTNNSTNTNNIHVNNSSNNNNNNNSNTNNNNINKNDSTESKDEVDFIRTKTYPPPTLITSKSSTLNQQKDINNQKCSSIMKKLTTATNMSNLYNDCEVKSSLKSSLSTLEKFSFFTLNRKNNHNHQNQQQQQQQKQSINNNNNSLNNINLNNNSNNNNNNNKTNGTINKTNGIDINEINNGNTITNNSKIEKKSTFKKSNSDNQMTSTTSTSTSSSTTKNKFVKSASIARLLGHTYNTKKIENELLKFKNKTQNINNNEINSITTTTTATNNGNNINYTMKKDQKINKKNSLTNFVTNNGNNLNSSNNNNNNSNRSIERFQMCSNREDELFSISTTNTTPNSYSSSSNNNQFNNNNNNYTSASYNNTNQNKTNHLKYKIKTNQNNNNNHTNTNTNTINNLNSLNCNNCISQNQSTNYNSNNNNINSNYIQNNSHNCNCNSINNNNNKEVNIQDFQDDHYNDISAKAFRTISRSLGKLWWKRTHSVEISAPDPEYKVSYLGNVLTGWAKGEGCVEKPLNTLWRNYTQNHKPDVIMRVRVCASGLKATTRQHGLTEYWANRVTHCCSPKNYPRVFCWIYRHEGRKLKHELRCHAILCSKESIAQEICNTLRENLDRALHDFKREKILKQNARLSLANSVYENPSLPRRKILLSVGGNNYRPPMERSKSAPKLMAIEEAIGEEEGEEIEQTNEPEMPSCCQKDSLYPAMTLGRRRCRRGHSIRRTGKAYKISFCDNEMLSNECSGHTTTSTTTTTTTNNLLGNDSDGHKIINGFNGKQRMNNGNLDEDDDDDDDDNCTKTKSTTSLGSDDDDLDKLLIHNNYDTSSPLAGELLSYFDMKLHAKTSSLTDLTESINCGGSSIGVGGVGIDNCSKINNSISIIDNNHHDVLSTDDHILYEASLTTDPSPRPIAAISLENLDNCSDGCEGDCGVHIDFDDEEDELYYRQTAILNLLHRNSMRKLANLSMSSDDSGDGIDKSNNKHLNNNNINNSNNNHLHNHQHNHHHMDSDEGSISSGCETASTVTANCEDSSLKYINDDNKQIITSDDDIINNNNEEENLCYNNNNNNNNQRQQDTSLLNENEITEIKVSNTTITFKRAHNNQKSPKFHLNNNYNNNNSKLFYQDSNHHYHHNSKRNYSSSKNMSVNGDVSDSEFSDESGYVEFQDQFVLPRIKSQNDYHVSSVSSATSTASSSSSPSSSSSVIAIPYQYNTNHNNNKN